MGGTMAEQPVRFNRALIRTFTRLADSVIREVLASCCRYALTKKRSPPTQQGNDLKKVKKDKTSRKSKKYTPPNIPYPGFCNNSSTDHHDHHDSWRKKRTTTLTVEDVEGVLDTVWRAHSIMNPLGGTALPGRRRAAPKHPPLAHTRQPANHHS